MTATTLEDFKKAFRLSFTQLLTIDASKCELKSVVQGVVGLKDGKDLQLLPFQCQPTDNIDDICKEIYQDFYGKELGGISFAANYIHYAYISNNN